MDPEVARHAVFDTDMQIHRLCEEPVVAGAAEELRASRRPVRVVAFSKVEFKGAYIQRLALLQNKVRDSDSLQELFARVKNTGGRGAQMMLAQLIRCIGRHLLDPPWSSAKAELLTHLDAQVRESWVWFSSSVDGEVDDALCTRATEPPKRVGSGWDVQIPECRKKNTRCKVNAFMVAEKEAIQRVLDVLAGLPAEEMTDELRRIRREAADVHSTGSYKWEGTTCRRVGDLLVALHARGARLLVTSNHREHTHLARAVGYPLEVFQYAQLRLK